MQSFLAGEPGRTNSPGKVAGMPLSLQKSNLRYFIFKNHYFKKGKRHQAMQFLKNESLFQESSFLLSHFQNS